MYGTHLLRNYWTLRDLGLVRCKRDFARRWLDRGETYLRDFEFRDRGWRRVNSATTKRLRTNLIEIAARSPTDIADAIKAVVAALDRDERIVATMASWSR